MAYDPNNVFAKVLRGEIPCKKIYEDDDVFAFYDIAPNAPVHALVVPKGEYTSYEDFVTKGSDGELAGFFRGVEKVAKQLGVGSAFRLITNNGASVGQSVPHFHVHILAGRTLGKLVAESD